MQIQCNDCNYLENIIIKYFNEKFKNIPVILMSGIVGVDVAISYDNISFISKPFTKESLVSLAHEAITKAENKSKSQYLVCKVGKIKCFN